MRAIESRVREFDALYGLLDNPSQLEVLMLENPNGSRCVLEGTIFEFGNVSRLRSVLNCVTPIRPFSFKPKFACHVVSLGAQRKIEIEKEFGLNHGSISAKGCKVNLMLVDQSDRPYFISYRQAEGQAKLGQVSTSKCYVNARLDGGLWGANQNFSVPLTISYRDTIFEEKRFEKLGPQDRELAYIKKNFPREWNSYCDDRLLDAMQQVRRFGRHISKNREEFINFLSQTFGGDLASDKNFYLLIGSELVQFSKVLEGLANSEFHVSTEIHKPRNKESLIVNIEINGQKYCVTKIEPSFDGGALNTEQTKGIIFYFQQHLKDGNNYKKLLLDVSK